MNQSAASIAKFSGELSIRRGNPFYHRILRNRNQFTCGVGANGSAKQRCKYRHCCTKSRLLMDLLMVEMNRNRLVLKIPVRFPVFFVIWTMLQFLFFIVVAAAMPPLLRHHCVDVAGQLLCVN